MKTGTKLTRLQKASEKNSRKSGGVGKGPYQNYVINHSGGVVVKMFGRNDKQGIVQDDIDDDLHRGRRLFKILENRDDVILIWSLSEFP